MIIVVECEADEELAAMGKGKKHTVLCRALGPSEGERSSLCQVTSKRLAIATADTQVTVVLASARA